ncbi:MAG: NAD-dependent succinate-semialdehyde dehydrogenase [Gammaproteobacteria bacterium]|nr:NAD-dependent succinate-semialdehyde dehydrogenase [Gammaproteobacteria bacterium]MDH5801911.1 NAD-dependent succinate-semialdehyde dehydrogenase [Gammaproteobacteria bacterium]
MSFVSINPANNETLQKYETWNDDQLNQTVSQVYATNAAWAATPLSQRCELVTKMAQVLRQKKQALAELITREMGKLYAESEAEIEKCAGGCEYYAEHGPAFMQDEVIQSDAGKSYVAYQPLGTVLAIMPWNFPFWQVFRFAAPAMVAGNTALLKHASNVPGCALAIETLFHECGFPTGVFRTLMIGSDKVGRVVEDPRVAAVTLTGSETAGRAVAALAGAHLKKSVLELGGSDAFIVLEDADMELTVKNAVISRYLNGGQSCIAAKRFIVVETVADTFVAQFKAAVEQLQSGDPMAAATTLAPMARNDLRDELHQQVSDSIAGGAVAVTGCAPLPGVGVFYQPGILDHVSEGMRAYDEELFGPVAIVIRVKDEAEAIAVANASRFGLGGSVWSQNTARAERVALQLQSGAAFVNGFVKSDPRLPFGGVKASGYGRELSHHGMREFMNAKTVWVR